MNWSPESSLVHPSSCPVGSASGAEQFAPQGGRQDALLQVTRVDGILLGGQNAPLCDEGFWAINEGIHILPRHFVD